MTVSVYKLGGMPVFGSGVPALVSTVYIVKSEQSGIILQALTEEENIYIEHNALQDTYLLLKTISILYNIKRMQARN